MMVIPARPTDGFSVASMVLGILGIVSGCCTFGIFSILAVIFGHLGLNNTKDNTRSGHGMAVAGLVMGYVFVIPMVILSIMMVVGGGINAVTPTPEVTP
jgi:hypothetical protein